MQPLTLSPPPEPRRTRTRALSLILSQAGERTGPPVPERYQLIHRPPPESRRTRTRVGAAAEKSIGKTRSHQPAKRARVGRRCDSTHSLGVTPIFAVGDSARLAGQNRAPFVRMALPHRSRLGLKLELMSMRWGGRGSAATGREPRDGVSACPTAWTHSIYLYSSQAGQTPNTDVCRAVPVSA